MIVVKNPQPSFTEIVCPPSFAREGQTPNLVVSSLYVQNPHLNHIVNLHYLGGCTILLLLFLGLLLGLGLLNVLL